MRIAFVTSCLELGRDGVGDYTRLLAQECVRQGCGCCLISLNDKFISQPTKSCIEVDREKIPVLRLPATLSWSQRTVSAKNFVDQFNPNWISLQFVPYGFQAKGIVFGLGKWLRQLTQRRQVHLMFHELWIGEHIGASLKDQVIGRVQKSFVLNLVKQLQPLVVHTSNEAYVAILKQHHILASRLPMFGAIPVSEKKGDHWLLPELQTVGIDIHSENRDEFWLFGFFGALHPIWPPAPLFTYLHQAATQHQRQIALITIGRIGPGEDLWNTFAKNYSDKFTFLRLGESTPTKVSEFFNSIDFGIATSPYALIGKSASVAAMLEHGLPVIVNRDEIYFKAYQPLADNDEPLLQKGDQKLLKKIGYSIHKEKSQSRLGKSAKMLLSEINRTIVF